MRHSFGKTIGIRVYGTGFILFYDYSDGGFMLFYDYIGAFIGIRTFAHRTIALHVLRKIHHCTFGRKFLNDLFRILPQNCKFYPSKILMTCFSHRPFLRFSSLPYLTDCPSFLFLNSKFSPQKFLNDFTFSLSQKSDDFFSPYFTDDDSYFLLFAHYTPLVYTPTCCFHVSAPCFVLS